MLPHYDRRIEDLRDFRNRYNSIISKVRDKDGRVEVELPEAPEDDLETLNRDLKGRLLSLEDTLYVTEDKHDELLVEMEAIADYSNDRIKVLKRNELITFTVITTFTVILLLNVLNLTLY